MIVELNPCVDARWRTLVERQASSAFHSPAWLQVLVDSYGFEVRAFVVLDEHGEPHAGLPFVRIDDLAGERIVSLPFSDYCDPLVSRREEWEALSDRVLAERRPASIRCLHNELPQGDARFTAVKRAKWHGVNLEPDLETLWQSVHESSRRAIRKAEREGVSVRIARDEETLRAFFELHLRVRKYKYRLLSQPYRFFESIWHHLIEKQEGLLMVASHRDTIIGGILFLQWQDRLYYKFNASADTGLPYRPNDLLLWEGIRYAKAHGYVELDFGLSDWDQEGLIRYKRKFATEEKTITFLRAAPAAAAEERPARQLLPQLTGLFTDDAVPDRVTEKAGDLLYRFFA